MPDTTTIRLRRDSLKLDRDVVAERVYEDYRKDLQDRHDWNDLRLQRYAKFRGLLPEKNWPWPDSSNVHLPILATDAFRTHDALYNAVLTSTPVIESKALHREDREKTERVDNLLHHQFFHEQDGEEKIAELADNFVLDGVLCAYVPWIRHDETVVDVEFLDPPPAGMPMLVYLRDSLRLLPQLENVTSLEAEEPGWSWKAELAPADAKARETRRATIEVYRSREDAPLEVVIEREVRTCDGPVLIPKAIEDWTVPFRAGNVQPPGPHNPNGAHHVNLVDTPYFDEIKRLQRKGYYDLLTLEELKAIEAAGPDQTDKGEERDEHKRIKDEAEGTADSEVPDDDPGAGKVLRIKAFTRLDLNGDGLDEDAVCWLIRAHGTSYLAKAKYLTEENPGTPPRRPIFAKSFIPVQQRIYGMSLLEMLEPIHDVMKILMDQGIDAGTLKNVPWGLIRAQSGLRNELIRIDPGTLYPTANPKDDLNIPQFGSNDAFTFNMFTVFSQLADRLSMIGDLQLGRVPAGKASALRTVSGMMAVLQQGDARPERLLRRFFSALAEIWKHAHRLNEHFLDRRKEFLIIGIPQQGQDPYGAVNGPGEIRGEFRFTFGATVLNVSKGLLQQTMMTLLSIVSNPLAFRMGVIEERGLHILIRDTWKAFGQDPDRHLTRPSDLGERIFAEEALVAITNGQFPDGKPAEQGGAAEHLARLQDIELSPDFPLIATTPHLAALYQAWKQRIERLAAQQAQRDARAEELGRFQQVLQGNGQGRGAGGEPPNPAASGNAPVSENELLDETMPAGGGGAFPGGPGGL